MSSIYRPRQGVQRLTPNAGNRRIVRGGKALARVVPTASNAAAAPVSKPKSKARGKG
jgi:hypothetical protein